MFGKSHLLACLLRGISCSPSRSRTSSTLSGVTEFNSELERVFGNAPSEKDESRPQMEHHAENHGSPLIDSLTGSSTTVSTPFGGASVVINIHVSGGGTVNVFSGGDGKHQTIKIDNKGDKF